MTVKPTDRYPVDWFLLSCEAPCDVNGFTTDATYGALATSAAASLTAFAYLESVSFPLLAWSTIGLVPFAWTGNDLLACRSPSDCWSPEGQVVAGVIAEPMRHADERGRRHQPHREHDEATPDAEAREPI